MSRQIRTLVIALGVLALLGGGYYGSTVRKNKKAESAPPSHESPPRLGNLDGFDLVMIEVPGIVLEKKGDMWELVSREQAPLEESIPPGMISLDQDQIRGLTYSLASVWADRVVDEEPVDLSVYGLDKPSSRAIVTDSGGKKAEYILGDMTPSRTAYYVMEEGDPRVYSVSSYSAENMRFTLDRIRNKTLFPVFEPQTLIRLRLEFRETLLDISVRPESARINYSPFSTHVITSPYKLDRGVNSEALYNLLAPLNGLAIAEFVDDLPSSLQPYGLNNPGRIILDTFGGSLDLLVGDRIEGKRYAKLADVPGDPQGVFIVDGLESVINARPFGLVDKFALLINIDDVDHLSVTGGERPLSADFRGKGEDGVYFLNGKKAETRSFRNFYQAVVGLLSDAEYAGPNPGGDGDGEITIEYRLNNPPGTQVSITLVPHNRDFYALRQGGIMEFLISRNQVRRIYETADAVIYEE